MSALITIAFASILIAATASIIHDLTRPVRVFSKGYYHAGR